MSNGEDKSEGVHLEVTELLPWYLNGSLRADEAARVASHMASCAECRGELATLTEMSEAVANSTAALPPASTELYSRTLDRIARFEAERRVERTPMNALRQFGGTLKQAWLSVSIPARFALAGQFVAIVLLIIGAAVFAQQSSRNQALVAGQKFRADQLASELNNQKQQYQTLAAECQKAGGNAVVIKVAFKESAAVEKIGRLLASVAATFIDGPTPQGFYTIAIPWQSESERQRLLTDTLPRLRSRSDVILFAEEQK